MKKKSILFLMVLLCYMGGVYTAPISLLEAEKIGNMIWKNECGGTFEGLTHWNKGENFASLGIGHFIWYPTQKREKFEETFPRLLKFFQQEGVSLPAWLEKTQGCPWNSREEFYENIQSPEMKNLRQFLFDTKGLQAIFIANHFERTIIQIFENGSKEEKEKITVIFHRLLKETNGLYAMIDYLNFKGAGTSSKEVYQEQGWGLLQVLQRIPPSSTKPLNDFVDAAKAILSQRVKNSPPEKHEERWLKGWFNRLDTYVKISP